MRLVSKGAFICAPTRALFVAVVFAAAIRMAVAGVTGLTDDEAYYRLLALAPAMSYLDHPPLAAWMIAVGRFVAGDNPFGIRLWAILAPLVGFVALWRSAQILFDGVLARRAVWFALAMPLLAVGGVVITPDTPSVLFWGLSFWALAELHASRNANWWLVVGLFAGLGLLSKYTNLFVGVGIGLWLILHPVNWRWFRAWQLWAGGALSVVLALPVVVWNWTHDWASFAKQFGRVVQGNQLTFRYLFEFIGAYIALASPVIAVLALAGCWRVTRSVVAARNPARLLLAVAILPLLVYFLLHALHNPVQPNWAAPLYPFLAICAGLAVGEMVPPRSTHAARFQLSVTRWACAVGFCMSGLLYLHAVRPLVLLPGSQDPTSQMQGWPAFASEVDRLRKASGACWVATSSYATTGQLAYQLSPLTPVVQLTERIRYVHLPRVEKSLFSCPGLYVELERRSLPEMLGARFAEVTALGRIARSYGGVPAANYAVYRLVKPTGPVLSN